MRILVAEDEKSLNKVITKRLSGEGYSVDSCFDGEEALAYLFAGEFDAAVLDIMMPKMSGIEVLKAMRARNDNTPVIFLTARDSISDRVLGLDSGAQDYLVKPFAFEELLARLRVLTRTALGSATNILTVSDLILDTKSRTAIRGGKAILLSAREYDILEYLMHNKNAVVSRETLENHVWNFDYGGGTNIVDVYIRYLRKKIDDENPVKLIHTVRGAGYVIREEA